MKLYAQWIWRDGREGLKVPIESFVARSLQPGDRLTDLNRGSGLFIKADGDPERHSGAPTFDCMTGDFLVGGGIRAVVITVEEQDEPLNLEQ